VENNLDMNNALQLNEDDKVYLLILFGGLGARVIQTVFIRSLIRKRKLENNNWPILVIDNTLIGNMVSAALSNQNVHGIQVPESPQQWPQDPGLWTQPDGSLEHPIFIESWRKNFQQYNDSSGNMYSLLSNNWSRAYQVEYGFSLTKLIHKHKHDTDRKSFIGNLYGKVMGLDYDGGVPMLKCTDENKDVAALLNKVNKPMILLHLGVDRNSHEFMAGINYRTHKVWSLEEWENLVQKLKHKYQFVQVYANQFNPEIKDVISIKVDNLNPVLQLLQSPKCKFFMGIDNYLAHLASSIKKRGIVLWGSVSPNVWGWRHNINVWNTHSCATIACWRPGMYDMDNNGKLWVCDHYSCMRSITHEQVLKEVSRLEAILEKDKNKRRVTL